MVTGKFNACAKIRFVIFFYYLCFSVCGVTDIIKFKFNLEVIRQIGLNVQHTIFKLVARVRTPRKISTYIPRTKVTQVPKTSKNNIFHAPLVWSKEEKNIHNICFYIFKF